MGHKKTQQNGRQLSLISEELSPKEIFRTIRNYLAGQFVGATRDDALLEEVLKCLFCKLVIENGKSQPIDPNADPFTLAKFLRSIFAMVRTNFPEIYEPNAEILLDPQTLKFVMSQLNFSVMDAASDPIGDAFEVFVGSQSRGNSGQFLTPRSVTILLVEAVNPQPGETVLDPACGPGGFFTSVCAHFLKSGLNSAKLSKIVSRDFFGIDKDAFLAKLAKVHLALLTGGHPHILCADSIALQNGENSIRNQLPKEGVDVLLTNPPFGVRIVSATQEVLQTFDLAKRWIIDKGAGKLAPTTEVLANVPPQVLFVERCLSLLKIGGRLGMVLPESILSNKSYRHVVEYILTHSDIQAVMGMPETLFKTSGKGGTHTKTCLLIATKHGKGVKRTPSVFMAEAKWCGQDSRARLIPNNDLPAITKNLKAYQQKMKITPSNLGFIMDKSKISKNVLCPRYYDPQPGKELNALQGSHMLVSFGTLVENGVLIVSTGDEIGKLAYGTGTIPFIRTSDISNWELKADPKHGVSKQIYESLRVKQDVQAEDILMVKDGTYLIGTCAIITEHDREMLYQSHLYKIRINPNDLGLNPYLLLAILTSSVVQKQIRSKQFTQDIIDSLGDRIYELGLPIPKDMTLRERITNLVKSAVQRHIEARELAHQARQLMAG